MERAFIISKETDYYKRVEKYIEDSKKQKEVVKDFFIKNEIDLSTQFYVSGNGFINRPFSEHDKSDINLYIIPSEKDELKLNKALCKPIENGLRKFKKGNKLLKEFQNMCIDNNVVINLDYPDLRGYFKSLEYRGYKRSSFHKDENIYLLVESPYLSKDEMLDGFTEIKISEFYKLQESL